MSAVINTNIAAVRTHGVYSRNNDNMNAAMTRVATAQKINSPRDNAADWAISEKLRERVRSLNQANQNVQNDTALMKTASGALSNTIDILKTLKERAINAANASNQDSDREKIQADVSELIKQIDTNAEVKFNGKALLDGSAGEKVASATKSVATVATADDVLSDLGFTGNDIKATLTWTDADGAHESTKTNIAKSKNLSDVFGLLDTPAAPSGFAITHESAGTLSGVTDKDGNDVSLAADGLVAIASATGTDKAITGITLTLTGTGVASGKTYSFTELQAAQDANPDAAPLRFQIGDDSELYIEASINKMDSSGLGISGISLSTESGAKSAMSTIDTALNKALAEQTKLGAYETRLGYTADNLSTQIENLEASDSAIRDADIAKEMTNYMKYSVLAQASQYMLAQAGQNAFSVLNLLQA